MKNQILGILKELRAKSGIRVSMLVGFDGKIISIHEDAVYVPKSLRISKTEIDKTYFTKWSIAIFRTLEFSSEKLFKDGINNIILEGKNKTRAILFNIKGKAILIGILTENGSLGLAYQAMMECVEKIAAIMGK